MRWEPRMGAEEREAPGEAVAALMRDNAARFYDIKAKVAAGR